MRHLLVTLTALAALKTPAPAEARPGCQSSSCTERVARKQCSQRRVRPCILRASLTHRVSYSLLVRRAWCESTLNPYAVNGPHAGLFQFNWGTWATLPRRYSRHSPFSAKWSSLGAAYMERIGRGNEWTC